MFKYFSKIKKTWKRLVSFMTAREEIEPEDSLPAQELYRLQALRSLLTKQFCFILALSTIIATLGLMGDSAVIIIGAMLIAPMMKPIVALAYSLVIGHKKLAVRATITLTLGIVMTILVSGAVEHIFDLKGETSQIIARIHPSLIDLGVAIAAGIAAALANVRRNVADSLPGVAIAVALVPPLCVVGIALSLSNWQIALGAAFLFSVNLLAIIVCACLVFLLEGYGSWSKSQSSLTVMGLLIVLMFIPLSKSLKELTYDDRAQRIIESYLAQQYKINKEVHPDDLNKLLVRSFANPKHIYIYTEIKSSRSSITQREVGEIKQLLEEEFNEPINLKIQLTVSEDLIDYSVTPNNEFPLYDIFLIPRR